MSEPSEGTETDETVALAFGDEIEALAEKVPVVPDT